MKHPLQAYREAQELTQKGLADVLGCSQSLVALIESGERGVSKANAETWEEKTGIPRLSLMFPGEYPLPTPSNDGPSTGAAP